MTKNKNKNKIRIKDTQKKAAKRHVDKTNKVNKCTKEIENSNSNNNKLYE